jgi:hypothetical protein
VALLLLEGDADVEEVVDNIDDETSYFALRITDPSNTRSTSAGTPEFAAPFPLELGTEGDPQVRVADASVVVASPGGKVEGELFLYVVDRESTDSSGRLVATDESRCLTVVISADFARKTGNLAVNWTGGAGVFPATVMPTLNFLRHFQPQNLLTFFYQGLELSPPQRIGDFWEPLPAPLFETIAKLDLLQGITATRFPIPDAFSAHDIAQLARAEALLQGEIVRGTWDRMVISVTLREGASMPPRGMEIAFLFDSQESVRVAGNAMPMGRARRHLLSARIERWSPSESDSRKGRLEIVPGEVDEFESWLPAVRQAEYIPVPGVSLHFRRHFDNFMVKNSEAMRRLAQ